MDVQESEKLDVHTVLHTEGSIKATMGEIKSRPLDG